MPDNVHVFKASYDLQSKVGKGPLDEDTVRRCQAVLDREASGFEDLAGDILDRLELAIEKARLGKHNENDLIDALDERHPRLVGYLRDESGALRRHVNVFVELDRSVGLRVVRHLLLSSFKNLIDTGVIGVNIANTLCSEQFVSSLHLYDGPF